MIEILILPTLLLTAMTGAAFVCTNVHERMRFREVLRRTFAPMTKAEFWFPPCPFCWLARIALVVVVAAPFVA